MGNLIDFLLDCSDCYDEFCSCDKGVSLENEYCAWYAESIMNENYKENN